MEGLFRVDVNYEKIMQSGTLDVDVPTVRVPEPFRSILSMRRRPIGLKTLAPWQAGLPRPDMVTTQTRWDVFLPVNPRYYGVDEPMDVLDEGARRGGRTDASNRRWQDPDGPAAADQRADQRHPLFL